MIRLGHISLLAIAVLLLAACTQNPISATRSPDASASPEADAQVMVATTDLGTILADADVRTVYAFTKDSDGKSVCNDDCAATWPPFTVEPGSEPTGGAGITPAWLGTIVRDDGSTQVTYAGHPLYYFAADEASGDTTGQGVGGVWFVVSAEGELIGAPAGSPDASSSTDASAEEMSPDASASGDY